jgi:hypothetical protein
MVPVVTNSAGCCIVFYFQGYYWANTYLWSTDSDKNNTIHDTDTNTNIDNNLRIWTLCLSVTLCVGVVQVSVTRTLH